MFLLKYIASNSSDGSGSLTAREKEFVTREELDLFVQGTLNGRAQYSKISIWTDVIEQPVQIDYKEKFEELYNHVLVNAGIRGPLPTEPKEKLETIVK